MSRWFRLALVGAAALVALDACNVDEDSPRFSAPRSDFGVSRFGAEGGVVASGFLTLDVPAGALSEPVEVRVTETFDVAVPEGLILLGPAYDLEPDGTRFSKPVVITIFFERSLGSAEPVLYHAAEGEDFSPVTDSSFDAANNVLRGSIDHFSYVAVFVTRVIDDGGAAATGGAGGGDDPAAGGESAGMGGAPADPGT